MELAAGTNFGGDYIAGGAHDDQIFGQLGNDTIQGDGSIDLTVGAQWSADGALSVQPSVENAASDGHDYIEGNGGTDVVFGNLGQDDIIGGSSSLFSLDDPSKRTDFIGEDILFGGAGTRLDRYALGQGGASAVNVVAEHAFDADVILGDNGNIFHLLDSSGARLTFNYDSAADAGAAAAQSRGSQRVFVRAFQLLDYTMGSDAAGIGASDLIKGEDGDDIIHGQRGNDVLYGDAWDDDIYGGTGSDKIFGGSGEDGIVADDGLIKTSRNGIAEPLYGIAASTQTVLSGGHATGAVVDITGLLKKTVELLAYDFGMSDIVYGGLGDDFIHGGAGNDALSGAEALPLFYNDTRPMTADPFAHDNATGKLSFYNADNPLPKVAGFLLNFEAFDSSGVLIEDGKDWIFGDTGNDAIFGGTGADRLFGGYGDDYLQLDDNLDTNGGLNDTSDSVLATAATAGAGDFAYGGGGRDVLIGNTGADRMFDWNGEYNSYLVPFSRFGAPHIVRHGNAAIREFLNELALAGGADASMPEPYGELGMLDKETGGPRDPQPGNGRGAYDSTGGVENDSLKNPLQNSHGSTPSADAAAMPAAPAGPSTTTQVEIHATAATAAETSGALVYTVSRSDSIGEIAINLGRGGSASLSGDYTLTASGGTLSADGLALTLPDGAGSAMIVATPVNDAAVESTETLVYNIAAGVGYTVGPTSSATGTIASDDLPALHVSSASVLEGKAKTSTVNVTVTLSAPLASTVTVTASTLALAPGVGRAAAGSDFVSKTQLLTFAPGVTVQTFSILINGDRTVEADEIFNVVLSNASGADIETGTGVVTIKNDD
jgi:Ca2+-binding RTX toxin-like protein